MWQSVEHFQAPPDEVGTEGKPECHFDKLNDQFASAHRCTVAEQQREQGRSFGPTSNQLALTENYFTEDLSSDGSAGEAPPPPLSQMLTGVVLDLVVARVVDLPSELPCGIPDDSCDRSFEESEGLCCIAAGLALFSGLVLVSRRIKAVKLGRLDVPFAEQVLCAGDLAASDQPEDHPLVQASGPCGGCKGIAHVLRLDVPRCSQYCAAMVENRLIELRSARPACDRYHRSMRS